MTSFTPPDLLVSVSREQDRRTWEWAKGHRLVERLPGQPEPGQEPFSKPLIEVIQNKLDARYATLWSLIKAIEQHAEREGLACLFVTMTLPPEYHPNPSHGGRSWNPALSPVRGAEELQDRWHRMLARARKAGVPVLGLWTLEPHKDGAPHRHAMIWLPQSAQAGFQDAAYSPDREGWHDYKAGPNKVCQECTPAQMADYMSRFGVPGQDPSKPVQDMHKYWVYDPRTEMPAGKVLTQISKDGLTITNTTLPGHVLYDGEIVRSATEKDGAWYVTTHGFGNNVIPGMNRINEWQGPKIFDYMDMQMKNYITAHPAPGS